MSTSAAGGVGGGGEKPGGFSRFLRRATSILRKDKAKSQSKPESTSLAPVQDDTATTSPAPAPSSTQTTAEPRTPAAIPPAPSKDNAEGQKSEVSPITLKSAMTAAENNKILEDKARALFAKYNMTFDIGEWTPSSRGDTIRVEKKIRMRIHRHCHRCQTMFGVEKQCVDCGHTRCKKCPRTKLTGQRHRKGKSVVTGGLVVDDNYMSILGPDVLSMPYRRTGKELARAARRICHKCQTIFPGNAPQCGVCGHQRCAQCPQDPSLSVSLAEGSLPRRRQLRSLRVRIRWNCHQCQKTFKDLETNCSQCGHAKCDDCIRDPAVGDMPVEDPEVMSRVEERLRNLDISTQAAAA